MTMAEVEKSIKEIWTLFRETDKKFKETDKKFKETDIRLDKIFKETEASIKKLAELFTGQWGKLIESLAESGILEEMQARDINITHLATRLKSRKNGEQREVDFLLTNTREIVVGEVKTTLKIQDVKDFLCRLEDFLIFYPQYRGFKVYGAIIGLRIEEMADRPGYKNGLFVLKVGGEGMVKLLNDAKFKPKDFGTAVNV